MAVQRWLKCSHQTGCDTELPPTSGILNPRLASWGLKAASTSICKIVSVVTLHENLSSGSHHENLQNQGSFWVEYLVGLWGLDYAVAKSVYRQQKTEGSHPNCWASSGLNDATEHMVHVTGPQVRNGHFMLKPLDSVTKIVDIDSAAVGVDLGILKWDQACRLRCWGNQG